MFCRMSFVNATMNRPHLTVHRDSEYDPSTSWAHFKAPAHSQIRPEISGCRGGVRTAKLKLRVHDKSHAHDKVDGDAC